MSSEYDVFRALKSDSDITDSFVNMRNIIYSFVSKTGNNWSDLILYPEHIVGLDHVYSVSVPLCLYIDSSVASCITKMGSPVISTISSDLLSESEVIAHTSTVSNHRPLYLNHRIGTDTDVFMPLDDTNLMPYCANNGAIITYKCISDTVIFYTLNTARDFVLAYKDRLSQL